MGGGGSHSPSKAHSVTRNTRGLPLERSPSQGRGKEGWKGTEMDDHQRSCERPEEGT